MREKHKKLVEKMIWEHEDRWHRVDVAPKAETKDLMPNDIDRRLKALEEAPKLGCKKCAQDMNVRVALACGLEVFDDKKQMHYDGRVMDLWDPMHSEVDAWTALKIYLSKKCWTERLNESISFQFKVDGLYARLYVQSHSANEWDVGPVANFCEGVCRAIMAHHDNPQAYELEAFSITN